MSSTLAGEQLYTSTPRVLIGAKYGDSRKYKGSMSCVALYDGTITPAELHSLLQGLDRKCSGIFIKSTITNISYFHDAALSNHSIFIQMVFRIIHQQIIRIYLHFSMLSKFMWTISWRLQMWNESSNTVWESSCRKRWRSTSHVFYPRLQEWMCCILC